jgi:hypothetical protein
VYMLRVYALGRMAAGLVGMGRDRARFRSLLESQQEVAGFSRQLKKGGSLAGFSVFAKTRKPSSFQEYPAGTPKTQTQYLPLGTLRTLEIL